MSCRVCVTSYSAARLRCPRCAAPETDDAGQGTPASGSEPTAQPPLVTIAAVAACLVMLAAFVSTVASASTTGTGTAGTGGQALPRHTGVPTTTRESTDKPEPSRVDPGESSRAAAASQMAALSQLFAAMKASRVKVTNALALVSSCQSLDIAVSALAEASDERADQRSQVRRLELDNVDRDGSLAAALFAAMDHSQRADVAYTQWGRAVRERGCGRAPTTDRTNGNNESRLATAAKQQVIARWNAVAPGYGYATLTETDI